MGELKACRWCGQGPLIFWNDKWQHTTETARRECRTPLPFEDQLLTPVPRPLTEVFCIRAGEFQLVLDGVLVDATWNSKGAAEAAIPIERERRVRKALKEDE